MVQISPMYFLWPLKVDLVTKKMENSFATQKWDSNIWGCKFSQLQSHIYLHHYLHFFQACTCQLMLLNSISCIQRSCPSAHVRFCVFHLWQTNLSSSFKARKRLFNIQDVWRKGISCICDLFVCFKYQYSDSGILNTPAEHLLFYLKIIWVALRKDMFSSISHTCISCIFIVYFCTCSLVCNNIAKIWAMFRSP